MATHLYRYDPDVLDALGDEIRGCLQSTRPVTLCVMGRQGSGKSQFGRYLRKRGLPGLPGRAFAVIDDGVMSVRVFGCFQRRIRNRSNERDELAPFRKYFKKARVVVYVASHPMLRLSQADIVVCVTVPDEVRRARLIERQGEAEGMRVFNKSQALPDVNGFPHSFYIELPTA